MKALVLYSRPGCRLCEELYGELAPFVGDRARIEHVDISADKDLMRRYGLRIPVVAGADGDLSGYPLDKRRIAAYLSD